MSAIGMTALRLRIAKFKFTHNFTICNQLPKTELIFGIDIQRKFSISYAWDKEENCYIQKEGKFLTYTKNCEQKVTIDQTEIYQTNSITLQKMMAEQVKPDVLNPPCHKLTTNIQNKLYTLLKENESQFAKDETSIRTTPLTSMMINTGSSDPVSQKPYPITMRYYQWVKEEIEKLLAAKVIHISRSSWSAPIIIVPKSDGGKCLLINYRALNKVTRKFTWPTPKAEDIFSKLNGATYFTLDLRAGYHHILLDKPSIPETAFNSPFGKYEYVKVPFGLAQALAYFQELMTGSLKDLNFVIAYLNDIIIFSKTLQKHLSHIRKVFEKLWSAKLSMKMSKCNFFSKEIQYLRLILSATGIQPLPSKTNAIHHMQPPTTPKQV